MRKLRQRVAASVPAFPLIPDTTTAELSVEAVSHRWPNGQQALNRCNLVIPGPGLWMLVGNNGSGKSTLFRLISGLLEPQSGRDSNRNSPWERVAQTANAVVTPAKTPQPRSGWEPSEADITSCTATVNRDAAATTTNTTAMAALRARPRV